MNEDYASSLLARPAYFLKHHNFRESDYFNLDTREQFRRAWRTHFQVEYHNEILRKALQRRPYFNTRDAFEHCDLDKNGFVTKAELRDLLHWNGVMATDAEVNGLLDRFDRNKDGRISFAEFSDELLPKSPVKHL